MRYACVVSPSDTHSNLDRQCRRLERKAGMLICALRLALGLVVEVLAVGLALDLVKVGATFMLTGLRLGF